MMRLTMRGMLPALVLLLLILQAPVARASHLLGADLYYDCLGNGVFRVYVKMYADCGGASTIINSAPNTDFTFISVGGGCPAPVALGAWQRAPTMVRLPNGQLVPCSAGSCVVTPLCVPNVPDNCTQPGSPLTGIIEAVWFRDYQLSPNCNYLARFDQCCRNTSTNIQGASGENTYISLPVNQTLATCNSSPRFQARPSVQFCIGNTYIFNQNVTDPNNDSLRYRLGPGLTSGGALLTYNPPFTPTNPMPSSPALVLDPTTGTLTVTPTAAGRYVVNIYVDEYRNGVLIGTTQRDIQVVVENCAAFYPPGQQPPILPPVITTVDGQPLPAGITVINDTVCVGEPVLFNLVAADPTPGQNCYFTFTPPAGSGATLLTPGIPEANPAAQFRWVPTTASPNPFQFIVFVNPDFCSLEQPRPYAIRILVVNKVTASVQTNVNCNTATIAANITGGAPPYNIRWSGPGGVDFNPNNTQPVFNHTYSAPGTYNITLTVDNTGDCDTTITSQVVIGSTGVTFSPGEDITLCSGISYTLGDAINLSQPANGQTFTWSPATGLSSSSAPNPVIQPFNNGTTNDTLRYTLSVTNGICSATEAVTVVVAPAPIAVIQGTTILCEGDTATLVGPPGQTAYVWSNGATTRINRFVARQSENITLQVAGTNGCLSEPAIAVLDVTPKPVAQVVGNTIICDGGASTFIAVGAATFQWSDGSVGNTLTVNTQVDTTIYVVPSNGFCQGDTTFVDIRVFPTPVVGIDILSNLVQCQVGSSYDFDVSGSYNNASMACTWSLGAGAVPAVSNLRNPSNVRYSSPGIKEIFLIVTDINSGCTTDTIRTTIDVSPNPQVSMAQLPEQCFEGNSFDFQYTGSTVDTYLWNFGPFAVPPTSTDQNPQNVVFLRPGTYNIRLIASLNGCADTTVRPIIVRPNPLEPTVLTDTLCADFTAILEATAPRGVRFDWYTTPTGGTPVFSGPRFETPRLTRPTTYYVSAVNQFGCPSPTRTPVPVVVYPNPVVDFSGQELEVEIPNAIVTFDADTTPGVVYFLWQFGDGGTSNVANPAHQYTAPGLYTVALTVVDSNGCTQTKLRENFIKVIEPNTVYFPTAFSPNDDLENDKYVVFTRLVTQFTFTVYNRSGVVVFQTTQHDFAWDGTLNNEGNHPLPEGVYVYTFDGKFFNDTEIQRNGTITIIR